MQRVQLSKLYLGLILVSIVAICISVYNQEPPVVTVMFGLGPLVWYHIRLMRTASAGHSQTTIDSVYYFGFLITIATLAATVLTISQRGIGGDYTYIVAQFGLGLVATGYALFARMQLMAAAERMDERDPDSIVDEYLGKVKSVVDKIELSAAAFESLADNLAARNSALAEQAKRVAEATIDAAANAFKEKMEEVLTAASKNFEAFGQNLGEIHFEDQVGGINDQFKSLTTSLTAVSSRLLKFEKLISSNEEGITRAAAAGNILGVSMQAAVSGVQGISSLSGEIGQLRSSVETVAKQAVELASAVGLLEKSLDSYVTSADQSLVKIETAISRSAEISGDSIKLLSDNLSKVASFIISETRKKAS